MPAILNVQRSFISALLALILTACGGGGGASGDSSVGAPNPKPAPPSGSASQPSAGGSTDTSISSLNWQPGSSLPTQSATKVFAPALTVAKTGQAHVMWLQQEGLSPVIGKIYTAHAALSDGRWSAPTLLAEGPASGFSGWNSTTGLGDDYNDMALLPLGTSGNIVAVWATSVNHTSGPLMMRRFNASTQQWAAPEALVDISTGRFHTAGSPQGHAAIAWQTAGGAQILVIDGQGQQRTLSLPGRTVKKLSINSQGTVAATWTEAGSQYLAVSDAPSWVQPIQLPGQALSGEDWSDLSIADDGEVALAWTLQSFEIATLVLRADGSYELPAAVSALNSSGKPSLVRGADGWQMAFVGSLHAPTDFATGSVLMNSPYISAHRWGYGWSSAQAISSTGPAGTGSIELLHTASDELTAVVTGYNVGGYSHTGSDAYWTPTTIEYSGMRPACAAQGSTGQAVVAWSDGVALKTHFRR